MEAIDVKSLVAGAMLRALDQETKDKLIAAAIAQIMEPTPGKFGEKGPSVVAQAFQLEVARVANEVVRQEVMTNPAVREKIREAASAAFDKFLTNEKLSDAMAERLWSLFDVRGR